MEGLGIILAGLGAVACVAGWLWATDRRRARRNRFQHRSHGQWNRKGSVAMPATIIVIVTLQVVFVVFKLAGITTWPWWCVLMPVEMCGAAGGFCLLLVGWLWWSFRSLF